MPLQYSKKPSDQQADKGDLREKIIGLGERSFRKSYYPELQKKLADLERFKTLLDQSNDAIILMDVPSGHIVDISESACLQFGYNKDECVSMAISELLPGNSRELSKIFTGRTDSLVLDTLLQKGTGEKVPYEVYMRRVRFGGRDYVVAIARNITERKRTETELRDAKTQAELYLDLMGHDINNINQAAMGFLELAYDRLKETGRLTLEDADLITIPIESLKNSTRLIETLRKIQKEKSSVYKTEVQYPRACGVGGWGGVGFGGGVKTGIWCGGGVPFVW